MYSISLIQTQFKREFKLNSSGNSVMPTVSEIGRECDINKAGFRLEEFPELIEFGGPVIPYVRPTCL